MTLELTPELIGRLRMDPELDEDDVVGRGITTAEVDDRRTTSTITGPSDCSLSLLRELSPTGRQD